MPGENVVGIDIAARLDQFRSEMAKIPDIGGKEAKALAAQLSKEIKGAEAAAKKAAAAGREGKDAFKGLGDGADAAGKASTKLRGVLSALSPELGAAAGGVNDVADALEVVAGGGPAAMAAAGALAVAAGGVYVAYKVWAQQAERTAAAERIFKAELEASLPIMEDTRSKTIDTLVVTGALTEEQGKLAQATLAAEGAMLAGTKANADAIVGLHKQMESIFVGFVDRESQLFHLLADNSKTFGPWHVALEGLAQGFDAVTTSSADLDIEIGNQAAAQSLLILQYDQNLKATNAQIHANVQAKDATKAHAQAAAELAAEFDALSDSASAEADRTSIVTDAVTKLMAASKTSADARLTGEAAVNAQLDETVRQYGEIAAAALLASNSETERAAIVAALNRANVEAETNAAAQVADIRKQSMEDLKDAIHEIEQMRQAAVDQVVGYGTEALGTLESVSSSATDLFAHNADKLQNYLESQGDKLTASEKRDLEERIAQQEKAALAAFYVGQGAAAATAAINTALAVSESLASLPYPANLIPAGLALAAGVGEEIAIAATPAPSFGDTPGVMQMEQGGNVHLAAGDLFVAAQTRRDLERQVAPSGGQGPIHVTMAYKHRAYDRFVVDNLRTNGPLATAFRSASGRVGHSR